MTICPSCGDPGQPDGARFCNACGSSLAAPRCVACGADLPPGSRFCNECGAPQGQATVPGVQPVAARRVTSVLFGDLVGFTTLSESRDQEQVRELLSRYFEECRAVVARYGGVVEKFIGDAVMAVWGVPSAHEDDAERAVRAGLELVARAAALGSDVGVPDLAMRVGVVTGEVAVTIGATHEGMVAGDAVNTAARVQSAAAPGQVWVDETTRLLTSSAITYVDVGSHELKGKAEPVPLWAVRAVVASVGGLQRADGLEAPLVGRDREMRLVKEVFHRVEETSRPALLVIDGEAGVGKSRLGWEFQKYVDGLTTMVLWHNGRCRSYGEGVAFYALAEAVRSRLQLLAGELAVEVGPGMRADAPAEEDLAGMLASALDRLVPDADERAWLEPRVAALLGLDGTGYARDDLFGAWATFLLRLSERGSDEPGLNPIVLLVDDAQHADDGLLTFLEHLTTVGTFPCFVVLLTRPGLIEGRPGLATHRRATVVHLDALSGREMVQLLDGLVSGLDDVVRTALVDRADGIPLYAVETVRSLIDRDLVVPRGGQYVLAPGAGADLDRIGAPASLHALVAARLDTLTPEQRVVVDRASVIGPSFTREVLAGLCPEVADLDAVLAELVRLQLLRRESDRLSTEAGQFQFVQAVVRQVAYGTLSRRDRKAAHLALVALLGDDSSAETAAVVASHYREAVDAVPDDPETPELIARMVEQLRRAADRARSLGAPAEAAALLRSALERVTEPGPAAQLRVDLAGALAALGDSEQGIRLAREGLAYFDGVGDEIGAARAVLALGQGLVISTGYDEILSTCVERYEALRGRDDVLDLRFELLGVIVQAAMFADSPDYGRFAEESAVLAASSGVPSWIANSYSHLSTYYNSRSVVPLGRLLLEVAAELSRDGHDKSALLRALGNTASVWNSDDLSRAERAGVEAYELCGALGSWVVTASVKANVMLCRYAQGDWDSARALLADDRPGWPVFDEFVRVRLALAAGERIDLDEAAFGEIEGDRSLEALASTVRAMAAAAAGDPAAGALALEGVNRAAATRDLNEDLWVRWEVAAEILTDLRDREAYAELVAVLDRHADALLSRALRAQRSRMAARWAAYDGAPDDQVEALFQAALSEARAWGSGTAQARIQADLGVWLARSGRHEEASGPLEAARTAYARMGAARWLAELEGALVGSA